MGSAFFWDVTQRGFGKNLSGQAVQDAWPLMMGAKETWLAIYPCTLRHISTERSFIVDFLHLFTKVKYS